MVLALTKRINNNNLRADKMQDNIINIYCDESCHLENDKQKVMVLGALKCPGGHTRRMVDEIRDIKEKYGVGRYFEVKWSKISPAKVDFYLSLVEYFYKTDSLSFRTVVVPDKNLLKHGIYGQSHDEWYYKMYFNLLKVMIEPGCLSNIYIDIKDTKGSEKIKKLHEIMCNNIYDFSRSIINKIQQVHSFEIEQLQLADLLIGAVKTANLGKCESQAKTSVVRKIKELSGYSLNRSTLLQEKKTNILIWKAADNKETENGIS